MMIFRINNLAIDLKSRSWCLLPYKNNPKGCPNYGKKEGCPPNSAIYYDVFDINEPLYLVCSPFNIEEQEKKMSKLHPSWSKAQCRNIRYWQGTNRKRLRDLVKEAMIKTNSEIVNYCPEALGINVIETCRRSGLVLDKINNMKKCHHIAIIGKSKQLMKSEGA